MKTQKELWKWLRINLGKHATGGLTSTDAAALFASVAMTPLISHAGAAPELFDAYRNIVLQMQPGTIHLAYHAIACELDWGHRDMIWTMAGIMQMKPKSKCLFE